MSAAADPVVIVSAARIPLGRFQGDLFPFSAHNLGSHVIGAAVERAKLTPDRYASAAAKPPPLPSSASFIDTKYVNSRQETS